MCSDSALQIVKVTHLAEHVLVKACRTCKLAFKDTILSLIWPRALSELFALLAKSDSLSLLGSECQAISKFCN